MSGSEQQNAMDATTQLCNDTALHKGTVLHCTLVLVMFGCHSDGQRKCIQCNVVHAQGQAFLQLYQKWDTGAVKGNCMQN